MNTEKPVLMLVLIMMIYSCESSNQTIDDRLLGMWRFDKFEKLDTQSGKWVDDMTRAGYTGYILYDGKGHMGVHLTPRGYKDFDSGKNMDSLGLDSLKALVKFYQSNFVYFADYTISDSTIDHKRLSATEPGHWGTVLKRDFQFINDTLILTPHEEIDGKKLRLRWIRL